MFTTGQRARGAARRRVDSKSTVRPRAFTVERLERRELFSTFTVANLNDSGPGSLRAGIADPAVGAINFAPGLSGTIILQSQLEIAHSLALAGPGQSVIQVSGNHVTRVFQIDPGANVQIEGLSIVSGMSQFGGGIEDGGTLLLKYCTVSGNVAADPLGGGMGGGIEAQGPLTVLSSTISGNVAGNINNTGGALGGGIMNLASTTRIINSIISNNRSEAIGAGDGAGIVNFGPVGLALVNITNSTISGNVCGSPMETVGGGILNFGSAYISHSDLRGNVASLNTDSILNVGDATVADSRLGSAVVSRYDGGIGTTTLQGTITADTLAVEPQIFGAGAAMARKKSDAAPIVPLLTINAGATIISDSLIFATPGEVDISSDNTIPGQLLLNGGVSFIAPSGSAVIASIGTGAKAGSIDLGGSERSFTINPDLNLQIRLPLTDGAVRKDGLGTLEMSSPSTYAGGTSAVAGTLQVDDSNSLGTGALSFSGGTVALRDGGTLPNRIKVDPTESIALDVGNQAAQLSAPAQGAALDITGSTGGSLTLTGPLALQHDLVVSNDVPVTINGMIGGKYGFTKTGTGALTLGGNSSNTWTGATTVDGGTLALNKAGGTLAVPADVRINGPSALQLLQPNQLSSAAGVTFDNAAGPAVFDLNGQSQTLASISSARPGAGTILLDGGTLSVADKSGYTGTITTSKKPGLLSTAFTDGSTTSAQTQRSEIRQLVLTFDRAVTLASGAVTLSLWNSGGSGTNNGAAPTDASAALGTPTSTDGGFIWIIPVQPGAAFSDATGSLGDGIYTVTLRAARVTANSTGAALDADSSTNFHRLFGDINGDKRVNNSDYFQFTKAFGSAEAGSRYNPDLDYNADGMINNADYFQFDKRLGRTFSY